MINNTMKTQEMGGGVRSEAGEGERELEGSSLSFNYGKLNPLQNQVKVPYLLLQFAGQREL